MSDAPAAVTPSWLVLALVGMVGGFFAGIFGIGGGLVMVPLLLWWTALDQRRAHASSLLAITPIAIVGAISYGIGGIFEWEIAALVAAGGVIGAQIGAWLLRTISIVWIRWGFVGFIVGSAAGLFLQEPERASILELSLVSAILLFLLGLAMGMSAGLFGIGGGVIVIPVLVLGFGQSDLVAKGVSLLAMAPGAISGSLAHLKHKTAMIRDGAWIAAGAALSTPLGAWAAFLLPPRLSAILFAGLLAFIAINLITGALRKKKP